MTKVVMISDYSEPEAAMRKPNHPADALAEHPTKRATERWCYQATVGGANDTKFEDLQLAAESAEPSDADATDFVDADVRHEPWRCVLRRKHVRVQQLLRQRLQQLRGAALLYPRGPIDRDIRPQCFAHVARIHDRHRNPRIAAHVADLLVLGEMCGHQLVAVGRRRNATQTTVT